MLQQCSSALELTRLVNYLTTHLSRFWSRLNGFRLVARKCDHGRLVADYVLHGTIAIVAAGDAHVNPKSKACLQFAHAGLDLMVVNGIPHFRRPMVVKLVRVIHEKNLINKEIIAAATYLADRYGILRRRYCLGESYHHLFLATHILLDHVLDFQLF